MGLLTASNSLNPNSERASGLTDGVRVSQQLLKGLMAQRRLRPAPRPCLPGCPEVAVGKDCWAERPLRTEHLVKG